MHKRAIVASLGGEAGPVLVGVRRIVTAVAVC